MKRINRVLTCKVTGKEITVKPDRYERLVEYFGNESKVESNFVCHEVEKGTRNPEFRFWFENCNEMKAFKKKILKILETFRTSARSNINVTTLQNDTFKACDQVKFNKNFIEFIQASDERGRYVSGLKLKNIPFIETYTITL